MPDSMNNARCLYCREPSHLPRLAYLAVAVILVLGSAAAVVEEIGFGTIFDFGPYPHNVRVFVIISTIVYLPLLLALPEFGRTVYFDGESRTLLLVRQGIVMRRLSAYPLDSIASLSVRVVTRMRGNVSEVGLFMFDGSEAHLFSYHSDDEKGANALSSIAEATGLEVGP